MFRSKNVVSVALSGLLCLAAMQSACAAASSADIVNAISAAHILDPSVGVTAKIVGDKVYVSTYRMASENDKDLKINAVIIAKAAFAATGDSASKVIVYFFGRDLSQYNEVGVTVSDVKAFGSGQVNQDQFLSSIEVHQHRSESGVDRVSNQLASGYVRGDFKVAMNGNDELDITTPLGDWVSDDESKLEALTIANSSVQSLPSGVSKIKISFTDPRSKADTRSMLFRAGEVQSMWQNVQSVMSNVAMTRQAPAFDIASVTTQPGPYQLERDHLLARIRELSQKGIGMGPFIKVFMELEAQVGHQPDTYIKSSVDHLSTSLDDQEKAFKAAKEAKTSKVSTAATGYRPKRRPDELGRFEIIPHGGVVTKSEVETNPDQFVSKAEVAFRRGNQPADMNPEFLKALDYTIGVLLEANKDAGKYQERALAMQKKGIKY